MGTTELGCTSVIDNIKKLEMTYSIIDDWLNKKWLPSHDKTSCSH